MKEVCTIGLSLAKNVYGTPPCRDPRRNTAAEVLEVWALEAVLCHILSAISLEMVSSWEAKPTTSSIWT